MAGTSVSYVLHCIVVEERYMLHGPVRVVHISHFLCLDLLVVGHSEVGTEVVDYTVLGMEHVVVSERVLV